MTPIYFLRLSKVWSMLHQGSVWLVHKKCYLMLLSFMYPFGFFLCAFIISISFFNKVSNFRNKILTNQKRELVVSNCQWNCLKSSEVTQYYGTCLIWVYLEPDWFCFFKTLKIKIPFSLNKWVISSSKSVSSEIFSKSSKDTNESFSIHAAKFVR